MNLLFDAWLPVRYSDGGRHIVSFDKLRDADILDFDFPRADFQGAAYQFAIGVLQTLLAPEDEDAWGDYYDQPPTSEELLSQLEKARHAFNMFTDASDSPLFMQDFDLLAEVEASPFSGLLIEAPGGNTLKHNTDHFIKRGLCDTASLPMAAIALFTLQINAPSGGQGHRTGLRGGGPLTTLVLPNEASASLWQKLWLNVLSRELFTYDDPDLHSATVFPWLAPTRQSKGNGTEVYAKDVHPLHMYWAMPRRIRLVVEQGQATCDLSGLPCDVFVREYRTQNYGYNYSGEWWHPLTHYRKNPKKPDEDNLSTKGQPGGITYKQWHSLSFLDPVEGSIPARVVSAYGEERYDLIQGPQYQRLWSFGYDMDNMKARGWYSTELPLFVLPQRKRDQLLKHIKTAQQLASESLWMCRTEIKSAWFEKPGDAKGDFSFIDLQFWQRTESAFFETVSVLLAAEDSDIPLTPAQAQRWLLALRGTALDLFDELVLSAADDHKHMPRFIKARRALTGWFFKGKPVVAYRQQYQIETDFETQTVQEV
ncbi:MAG: type I-E CRISPR-associated protein Cse1/CasA [Nitrincola lacisaponensis]|uniref:type I-E CRISPR-associated protein Cse1/CasA n=1 Tax=Nitrincola lacisaponensis TaxID=267850 RepID=UPI00391B8BA2